MFQNILLGVDGSVHALKAARLAGELVRTMQADLRVVVAFDPIPAYLGEPNLQHAISARMEEAEVILNEALAAVGETPRQAATEVLEGSAAEAILSVAKTRRNDLIVIGSRGRGQLAALLLGSQSNKVIQHADCPVLVVR
jgi:nucleotide-binding universal stress UspA family protein